jgi:hypothetical protein
MTSILGFLGERGGGGIAATTSLSLIPSACHSEQIRHPAEERRIMNHVFRIINLLL